MDKRGGFDSRFADAGALRSASDEDILKRFIRAFSENPDYAMRILFYARDIRGGLGERRFFRVVLYKEFSSLFLKQPLRTAVHRASFPKRIKVLESERYKNIAA